MITPTQSDISNSNRKELSETGRRVLGRQDFPTRALFSPKFQSSDLQRIIFINAEDLQLSRQEVIKIQANIPTELWTRHRAQEKFQKWSRKHYPQSQNREREDKGSDPEAGQRSRHTRTCYTQVTDISALRDSYGPFRHGADARAEKAGDQTSGRKAGLLSSFPCSTVFIKAATPTLISTCKTS